jgi:hypothetical protein
MANNHLEQLVAEWLEFRGYYVRRNVRVGKRPGGGYDCELDIVAFNPEAKRLLHVEPSNDAGSWEVRERRFSRKFAEGKKHIPRLFSGMDIPEEVEQFALLGFASTRHHSKLGGATIILVPDLLRKIISILRGQRIAKNAVPEGFPLLRTLQLVGEYRAAVFETLSAESESQPATWHPLV